jgi:hypothetical protein
MSATAIAKPIARKSAAERTGITANNTVAGIPRTQAVIPERLTPKERKRLWAESKDDDDFTERAIAFGKLTGDFTIDRHILPQMTGAEIDAEATRLEAEHPELYKTPEQVRGAS